MRRNPERKTRTQRGASAIVLTLIIAFFAVLPLSLLGFEMSRYFLIQSELQHVLDCAALSGTAALAQPATSATGTAAATQQTNAMNAAILNFRQNSVLQTQFTATNTECNANTGIDNANPPFQHATLNITLEDAQGNLQKTGSLTATIMKTSAAYTDGPVFAGHGGLAPVAGMFTVRAYAVGGLPQLDLVLCFDISGSMDDATPVTLVNRHWNGTTQQVEYQTVVSNTTIYNISKPLETGTSLNASWPQNLSYADYAAPTTKNGNPYIFSEGTIVYNPTYLSNNNQLAGLRANLSKSTNAAIPEQGCPPGNFDPTSPTSNLGRGINWQAYPGLGFTDMVYVPTGYSVASAVEASRGNLVSNAILLASQGGTKLSSQLSSYTISPTSYTDYWNAVNAQVLPMSVSRTAAVDFFNQMNTSANVHISLVTFASTASGTTSGGAGTYNDTNNPKNYKTDSNWLGGGTGTYTLPYIALQQNSFTLADVVNAVQGSTATAPAIQPLNAENGTDISDALSNAIDELTNKALVRPNAKKAVVLFTDGIPTLPISQANGTTAALAQATRANKANIPIYTIGLSTNTDIAPDEAQVLGDKQNGSGPGIAYVSGLNATYTSVTNALDLQKAFQKIARSLVVLQTQN